MTSHKFEDSTIPMPKPTIVIITFRCKACHDTPEYLIEMYVEGI
jgi:hypothetical protein